MEKQGGIATAVRGQFDRQVAFLQRLVQARSANAYTPETSSPDIPVEAEVATVIQQELQYLGLPREMHGVSPQRPNVLCFLPGAGTAEKTVILTTHMDTVAPTGYTRDPWGAEIEQGRLYGVGASDAKAQIAAFIYAMVALQKAGISAGCMFITRCLKSSGIVTS